MDDPDCSWPAWKFGMKRDELFTKLHDQYNTIAFSIQDPEAFHHDVYEISNVASTVDEFHRLLADRKQLRLNEMNQSLESASFEIIANPNLIGTDQWQFAVQLFRTRSLDSLVRYFSSYLPDDHPWHHCTDDPTTKSFFDDLEDDGPLMTHEPFPIDTSIASIPASHLPPSPPRSLTTCSEKSAVSTPARTLSFSEPETDMMVLSGTLSRGFDYEETSQSDDPDTPISSVSDMSDIQSIESQPDEDEEDGNVEEEDELRTSGLVVKENTYESETPTPRAEFISNSYISGEDAKISFPSKPSPLHRHNCDGNMGLSRSRRRSPEIGRVQKSAKGRRRILAGG
ncbi:hypothetical protein F4804DRAFT_264806 [Jackrogersella minutella]|nr:hypothetical protein F4804DRAFT_264806 [Jackrogersella minutella]